MSQQTQHHHRTIASILLVLVAVGGSVALVVAVGMLADALPAVIVTVAGAFGLGALIVAIAWRETR